MTRICHGCFGRDFTVLTVVDGDAYCRICLRNNQSPVKKVEPVKEAKPRAGRVSGNIDSLKGGNR